MTVTIDQPTGVVQEAVQARRWTREEYARLIDHGILGEDDHVQLIEGELIQMAPQRPPHALAISIGPGVLAQAFGVGYHVRAQLPLALGPSSEPEPDLAVIPGQPRDYLKDHPTAAVLIVEVSDTTLGFDRHRKGSLYAREGVREYWILNVARRQLEVYRDPAPAPEAAYGAAYETRFVVPEDGEVAPLAAPSARIRVRDLLP